MLNLTTKQFSKWTSKQKIPKNELATALAEIQAGNFEANLGRHIYKKGSNLKARVKVAVAG